MGGAGWEAAFASDFKPLRIRVSTFWLRMLSACRRPDHCLICSGNRGNQTGHKELPYVGVAAWISKPPPTTLLATIRRAVSGPERRELVALPESRNEVETIAGDLPKPSTILLGDHATKAEFKRLPLNQYAVIHLALHGYADPEFPDRSALVFAPHSSAADDGLLQVREIRTLPLNTNLVTLSACDTGMVR